MARPKLLTRLSQFWLPSLLFLLSVVSILFTWRHDDDIPVLGPHERSQLDNADLANQRMMINQALQGSGALETWCYDSAAALQSIRFTHFDREEDDPRWRELRRYLPQREQDALQRCHSLDRNRKGLLNSCFYLIPKSPGKNVAAGDRGLFLVEMTMELRSRGSKKVLSCKEALAHPKQPIEWVAWYSYYWTPQTQKKPLRFERLTGGTRIALPLAQNAERSTASGRP